MGRSCLSATPRCSATGANLELGEAQQAQGAVDVYTATEPCIAWIAGVEWATFSLQPMFIAGANNALWGHRDFLDAYPVTFDTRAKEFVVTVPDAPDDWEPPDQG